MSNKLSSCTSLISRHFQLAEEELEGYSSFEALETALESVINNLLNQDITRLLNAFYRIDLSEEVFKNILSTESSDQIGRVLAREVINRELEKVKTREKYRKN